MPFVLAACGGVGSDESTTGDNLAPIIEGTPPTSLAVGTTYTFTPLAADPDGDPLTFTATNVPDWATFDKATGTLSGTPTEANVGTTEVIQIEVTDSKAHTQLPGFRIHVSSPATTPTAANQAPTIEGTPATTAVVGKTYSFAPVADDPDGNPLTFSIQNRPSWMTFTSATGRVTGTPATTNVGTTGPIVITVSDGQATASLEFTVTVAAATTTPPANRSPTITGTPATSVTAGSAYNFLPVGSDPDGNVLRFSILNKPTWASFSTSTGRLSGTPTTVNVGTSARITISVTDGTATASLPSFTIQVLAPANRPPTISGSPLLSAVIGSAYSFQPSATDPDGNTLTFSIQNRPSWATFNTATGRLSGTPSALDLLTFSNIIITVSDGTALVSLPAFNLTVLALANGSATVSWTPPTSNADGSPLTDLAGYRIAYGTTAGALDKSVAIDNPGLSSFTVENLGSGTWYFGVIAVNSAGLESPISNVATKIILL
jgi:hypothetical protein